MKTNSSDSDTSNAENSTRRFSKAATDGFIDQMWKKLCQISLPGIGILVFFIVCLVTLWGLFTLEENIRGKYLWNKYKSELIAKGEWFGDDRAIPPKVLDSENFAMTPCLAGLFANTNTIRQSAYDAANVKNPDPYRTEIQKWRFGREIDFTTLLQNLHKENHKTNAFTLPQNRAEASAMLMKELEENEVKLREIEQALSRPHSRFGLNYERKNKSDILLPHLFCIRQFATAFAIKSVTQLALGQTKEAIKNMEISFRLENTITNEPFIVSRYVQMAMFEDSCQPLWEGLARHQWSDEQLQVIQNQLDQIDFLASMNATIRTDLDFLTPSLFDLIRDDANQGLNSVREYLCDNWTHETLDFSWYKILVPRGWTYLDQLNTQRIHEKYATYAFDISKRIISPTKERQGYENLKTEIGPNPLLKHTYVCKMFFTPGFNFGTKTAYAQTLVDEATIACALERFRLANGHYPERLEALTPKYMAKLPHDIINGEPLKYRLDAKGQYILYSIGWDEKDNNGLQTKEMYPFKYKSSEQKIQTNSSDWVWSSTISRN